MPFYIPSLQSRGAVEVPDSCHRLLFSVSPTSAKLEAVMWFFPGLLICVSLSINDVKHLFLCPLYILFYKVSVYGPLFLFFIVCVLFYAYLCEAIWVWLWVMQQPTCGVRGQLWVSGFAFSFVWDRVSCCVPPESWPGIPLSLSPILLQDQWGHECNPLTQLYWVWISVPMLYDDHFSTGTRLLPTWLISKVGSFNTVM